jgi:hypothetical protein
MMRCEWPSACEQVAARSNSKCGHACSMSGICSRTSCQKRAQRSRASVRSCELGYDVDWRAADVRFGVIHVVWQTSPLSPVHPQYRKSQAVPARGVNMPSNLIHRIALIALVTSIALPLRAQTPPGGRAGPEDEESVSAEQSAVFDVRPARGTLKETVRSGQQLVWRGRGSPGERRRTSALLDLRHRGRAMQRIVHRQSSSAARPSNSDPRDWPPVI